MTSDPRLSAVISALNTFVASGNEGEDLGRLYELLEGFEAIPGREAALVSLLGVMERHPVADLGTPGPLVHELEAISGYEQFLRTSIRRKPSRLAIWMANRIANDSTGTERQSWLDELRAATTKQDIDPIIREDARRFLAYQASQDAQE